MEARRLRPSPVARLERRRSAVPGAALGGSRPGCGLIQSRPFGRLKMKRWTSLACAAALLALLSGCTKRADVSSWESTQTSLEAMSKSLPKEKVPQFSAALGLLVAKSFGPSNDDTPEARA